MMDLLDVRKPEADATSYRKVAGRRSRPIDSAGLSHDYEPGSLARYVFPTPPEEVPQAFVSYSISSPLKQRPVDHAWYSAVLDKTRDLYGTLPGEQRPNRRRGERSGGGALRPDRLDTERFWYAHLDAISELTTSENLLTWDVARLWTSKGRPRSAAAGAVQSPDLFRRLMAVARASWAGTQLDRIRDFAASKEIDVGGAVETARTVVRQFREAGTPVDDVSIGVENDIFVKAGRITVMIDVDGDVAIALPLDGGERRYLDIAPEDVAHMLAGEDVD